ncbi:MAG: Cna B-type domain-containing protein [Eubacteriales bacterium]|nr:Cna B-type domain-containing protein [Eubacteriales bacterium]
MKKQGGIGRVIAVFFALLLSLTNVFSALPSRAAGRDLSSVVALSDQKLVDSSSGKEITTLNVKTTQTTQTLTFTGKYDLSAEGATIKRDDFFVLDVPERLTLKDGSYALKLEDTDQVLGQMTTSQATNKMTFTFNENVENRTNIRGTFRAVAVLHFQQTDTNVQLTLPGGQSITIELKPKVLKEFENEHLFKAAWGSDSHPDYIQVKIRINRNANAGTAHVILKDQIDIQSGSASTYIPDSFILEQVQYHSPTSSDDASTPIRTIKLTTDPEEFKDHQDDAELNVALLTIKTGNNAFELDMGNKVGNKQYQLRYRMTSPQDGTKITNNATIEWDAVPQVIYTSYGGRVVTRTYSQASSYSVIGAGATITGDLTGKIKIAKVDAADLALQLPGAKFEIVREDDPNQKWEVETDSTGIATSPSLPVGWYTVTEIKAPTGYILDQRVHRIEMKDGDQDGNIDVYVHNVPNIKEITYEATKKWVGGKPSDHKPVNLGLYVRDEGQPETAAVLLDPQPAAQITANPDNTVFTYRWQKLPEVRIDGQNIIRLVYSVMELDKTGNPIADGAITDNYKVCYGTNQVLNTYTPGVTSFTVTKTWIGGPAERPTIHIQLYRQVGDGAKEAVDVPVEFANGKLTHTWTNLDKTNAQGEEYTYSAAEVDAPANYIPSVENNTIKNSYVPPTVDITGKKIWQNGPTERPTIKLQLLRFTEGVADPELVEEVELANGVTEKVWAGLPATDMEGRAYSYKVVEPQAPDHYDNEQTDDTTITNKYVPPVMDYTVNKIWNNGPAVKPTIKLQLFRDGVEYGPAVELTNGMTSYTWAGLPVTDMNGKPHTYTVDEIDTPTNYEKHVEGNTITNTYVPGKTGVAVQKVWKGAKLKSVEVILFADGKEAAKVTLSDENGWKHVFADLADTTTDGKKIEYTIKETEVKGYKSEISGDAVQGFTVTNTQIVREVPPAKVTPPNTGAAPIAVLPLFGSLLAGAVAVVGRKYFKAK